MFIGALDDAGTCLRTEGIGAFLSASIHGVPLSLSHHVRHNRAVQKRLVLVSVQTLEMPFIGDEERAVVRQLADGIDRVILRFGFMEDLAIPAGLASAGLFTRRGTGRDQLLYRSRDGDRRCQDPGHGTVARIAVRLDAAQYRADGQFVLHSVQPVGGDRDGGPDLAIRHPGLVPCSGATSIITRGSGCRDKPGMTDYGIATTGSHTRLGVAPP